MQPTRTGACRPPRSLPWIVVTLRHAMTIAFGAAIFVLFSFLVARWLTAENRERTAVTDLLRAQAGGDAASMVALIDGLRGHACLRGGRPAQRARAQPARARSASCASTPAPRTRCSPRAGPTRVAWDVGGTSLPVRAVRRRRAPRRAVPRRRGRRDAASARRSRGTPHAEARRSASLAAVAATGARRRPGGGRADAARRRRRRPPGRPPRRSSRRPSSRTLYRDGPSGRFLVDGTVALPPRPGLQR